MNAGRRLPKQLCAYFRPLPVSDRKFGGWLAADILALLCLVALPLSAGQSGRELAILIAAQELEPAPIPEDPVEWGPTTTINDAIAAWRDNGWSDLSPNTAYDYATVWRVHIQGSIGRQRIASLSPFDIERFLRGLKEKGLSKYRVQRVRAVLHRACRLARK